MAQLEDTVRGLARLRGRLDAAEAACVAELARQSAPGAESFLRGEMHLSSKDARAKVKTAAGLEQLCATAVALEHGEITADHARVMAGAADSHAIDEQKLLVAARVEPADTFAKTVRRHQNALDDDGGARAFEKLREARKAHVFQRDQDAMTIFHAQLDPIAGATFTNALAYWTEKQWRAEHGNTPVPERTTPQRMADAAVAMAQASLNRANTSGGVSGGGSARPTVMVIADYDALNQQLASAELINGTPVPVETAKRLACDAHIVPAIFDSAGQPLDVGRDRRLPTTAQRHAVNARDRHCVAPGCNTPHEWCQIHHIDHWTAHLGPTNLDNLCLLCSKHHHLCHEGGWSITPQPDHTHTLTPPPQRTKPRNRDPN